MKKNGLKRVLTLLLVLGGILILELKATAGIFPESQFGILYVFTDLLLAAVLVVIAYYMNWGKYQDIKQKWEEYSKNNKREPHPWKMVLTLGLFALALFFIEIGAFRLIVSSGEFGRWSLLLDMLLAIITILVIIQVNLKTLHERSDFIDKMKLDN